MEKYKKGDYIAVMTNQPDIHFLEMFGHGLSIDNVEPSEYVAKIKNVIDDDNYLIFIVHPTTYRCVVSGSEIIRKMSDDELTAEIRQKSTSADRQGFSDALPCRNKSSESKGEKKYRSFPRKV